MTALKCISRAGCGWPELCRSNGYCMRPTQEAQTSNEQVKRYGMVDEPMGGGVMVTVMKPHPSGSFVRYDDIKHLLHPETPAPLENEQNGYCPDGQPHMWRHVGGEPFGELECARCPRQAPYPFCRTPERCSLAARCCAEFVCND